jgi:hypothetical protein
MMNSSSSTTSFKESETNPYEEARAPTFDPRQLLLGFHPRKVLDKLAEDVRRTVRVGNYWYWLEVPELGEGIEIARLICPLRYDVVVRRDFYSFYEANRDRYRSDFDGFVEVVKQSSYYTWFAASEAVRTRPYLLDDHDRLWGQFVNQIRVAAALHESLEKRGFDEQDPIVLRTAEKLLPPTAARLAPPTGKLVSDRYFMADGCHRLAWLMSKGYTVLPSAFFRIQCFREFSPFDSTSLLARSLPIAPSEYYAFLSSRYCRPFVFEDRDGFLEHIRQHRPDVLDEVLSVMRVDGFESTVL